MYHRKDVVQLQKTPPHVIISCAGTLVCESHMIAKIIFTSLASPEIAHCFSYCTRFVSLPCLQSNKLSL